MICSPPSEIAFSQVREDPTIEQQVIDRLARRQSHPLRVLLVASGGCTALSLLAHPAVEQIEAIDLNSAQLHLVELRRSALLHLSLDEQFALIGAETDCRSLRSQPPVAPPSPQTRQSLYERLRSHLPDSSLRFWDARPGQIAFGVNRVGRFEQLFRELAAGVVAQGLNPLHAPNTAIHHPQWKRVFDTVFERGKLAHTFGEAAVNYSMDRGFGEHFADVFAKALQRFVPTDNYFITQVWDDRYTAGSSGVPPYLQAPVQAAIRSLGSDRLRLHQGPFAEAMLTLSASGKFDLIQFSNISDWMPLPNLHQMLKAAVNCLQPGGALIGRRLNGDHHLAAVMSEHVWVDARLSADLLKRDRSFFYREVVVGFHA